MSNMLFPKNMDFIMLLKKIKGTSPGCPVVKNPPCNAGDVGSIPGQGTKIPYAAEQLSPPYNY